MTSTECHRKMWNEGSNTDVVDNRQWVRLTGVVKEFYRSASDMGIFFDTT
jgi:hypothetical protein